MSKNHVFRPQVSEILESRAVPSLAGVTLATGIHGISVTLPQQVSLSNPQVQAAVTSFDQSYIEAVDTLLASNETSGLVPTPSSRATFVSTIEESLETLAEQIVASLGTTATTTGSTSTTTGSTSTTTTTGSTTTGSTTTTAAKQVVTAIVGGGSTSLESQILALSIEQLESQVATTTTTTTSTNQGVVPTVVSTAEQVRTKSVVPELASVESSSLTDLGSSTGSSASSQASDAVRSAFGGFLNDYFKAVRGTLLAAGSNGQVNPSSNRAAFNVQVDQSIHSLDLALTASLARFPATSGLGPQIQSALEGNGASSLKTQLASLATPEAAQGTIVREFTLASTRVIAQVLATVSGDVAKLIGAAGP